METEVMAINLIAALTFPLSVGLVVCAILALKQSRKEKRQALAVVRLSRGRKMYRIGSRK